MEKPNYCGSAKQINDGFTKITLCLSDLPKEFIFEYNGKKYIKLDLAKKKEVDKFGKTHSLKVDTWRPESKVEDREVYKPNEVSQPLEMPEPTDDLPF